MRALVLWLLVGVPALIAGAGLLVSRSPVRARVGMLVLAVACGVLLTVHPPSGALIGGVLALLYAAGRGGSFDRQGADDTRLPPAR